MLKEAADEGAGRSSPIRALRFVKSVGLLLESTESIGQLLDRTEDKVRRSIVIEKISTRWLQRLWQGSSCRCRENGRVPISKIAKGVSFAFQHVVRS